MRNTGALANIKTDEKILSIILWLHVAWLTLHTTALKIASCENGKSHALV